jgi:hypothetical protein
VTTTFLLRDTTNLKANVAQAWVAGWINGGTTNFQVLQGDGSFGGGASPASVPFYLVSAVPSVSLSVATNGNDRLLFAVSATKPTALAVSSSQPTQYTQYPYANTPGVAAPGPFDVFEFGMDAQDDVSAVSGFGLNLAFSVTIGGVLQQFGAQGSVTRAAIGKAFTAFIDNEAKKLPAATAFAQLLYDGPITSGAPAPPAVDNQYFAIADPNDMLGALTGNYVNAIVNPLTSYWDSTLTAFFAVGNYLSINLSSNPPAPNIYSGVSSKQTNPKTRVESPAFTLSNGANSYTFFMPLASGATLPGQTGAQYVFQQAFGDLTPAGSAGDAGLLQDCIWEALCRGVALDGISATAITKGESTAAWNKAANWYQAGKVSHLYAKFLHYSTSTGTDSRAGGTPIMYGNAAYGFSMDENPLGPYAGPNVPSKTVQNVPDGSTVTVYVGPWDVVVD